MKFRAAVILIATASIASPAVGETTKNVEIEGASPASFAFDVVVEGVSGTTVISEGQTKEISDGVTSDGVDFEAKALDQDEPGDKHVKLALKAKNLNKGCDDTALDCSYEWNPPDPSDPVAVSFAIDAQSTPPNPPPLKRFHIKLVKVESFTDSVDVGTATLINARGIAQGACSGYENTLNNLTTNWTLIATGDATKTYESTKTLDIDADDCRGAPAVLWLELDYVDLYVEDPSEDEGGDPIQEKSSLAIKVCQGADINNCPGDF